ncbi:GSCFA domain-containing protein [Taibaiella chishuiensis]|uniref:GSCFA family protein n=1 Tax=Taibaiella chishuiensis TaxID=1434707 RepID=A0A2P8CZA2_9BACT|nr:GSCFA domain-containing protein [Taibaiella chishuiensis]PSK90294.1 GSCFA family protein [Taibaiella chishuiensis]
MNFTLPLTIPAAGTAIRHQDKILLTGSCFTEHMSSRMEQLRMDVLANPSGILFNPESVADSLNAYIDNRAYTTGDLFCLQEIWNCWDFHSDFSATSSAAALDLIHSAVSGAGAFLAGADWLIVTLGSAFQYFTTALAGEAGRGVANCHRAPGQWFEKRLLPVATIVDTWRQLIGRLQTYNPKLKIIFTISPVRHVRDGVVDNNRSKARLIEAVHTLVATYDHCSYFPAYEIVIDILRDHRFYDVDMIHPNYAATQYVWERFADTYFTADTRKLLGRIQDIQTAWHHKVRFPDTEAHCRFKASYREKLLQLKEQYPYLDLEEALAYFSSAS